MPSSIPTISDGALRTLRRLAFGTSCTIALGGTAVVLEERRRMIHVALDIQEHAKKIKSSRRYHCAGMTLEDHWLLYNSRQETSKAVSLQFEAIASEETLQDEESAHIDNFNSVSSSNGNSATDSSQGSMGLWGPASCLDASLPPWLPLSSYPPMRFQIASETPATIPDRQSSLQLDSDSPDAIASEVDHHQLGHAAPMSVAKAQDPEIQQASTESNAFRKCTALETNDIITRESSVCNADTINDFLKACYHEHNLPFKGLTRLYEKMRKVDANAVNEKAYRTLWKAAMASSVGNQKLRRKQLAMMEKLGEPTGAKQGLSSSTRVSNKDEIEHHNVYISMVRALNSDNPTLALDLFEEYSKGNVASDYNVACAVEATLRSNMYQCAAGAVKPLLRRMKDEGVLTEKALAPLLHYLLKESAHGNGNIKTTLENMRLTLAGDGLGLPRNVVLRLASVLIQCRRKTEALELLRILCDTQDVVSPRQRIVELTVLLRAYASMNKIDEMKAVCDRVCKDDFAVDRIFKLVLKNKRRETLRGLEADRDNAERKRRLAVLDDALRQITSKRKHDFKRGHVTNFVAEMSQVNIEDERIFSEANEAAEIPARRIVQNRKWEPRAVPHPIRRSRKISPAYCTKERTSELDSQDYLLQQVSVA